MFMKLTRLSAVVVFGLLAGCKAEPSNEPTHQSRPVKEFRVLLNNSFEHEFPGEVKASEQALLAFRVPGEITGYPVKAGEHVKANQLLVALDDTSYRLAANAAQAAYDLARVQHDRATTLVKSFLISQQDFDQSKAELLVAEANLKNAQLQVAYCRLYAPFDGIVANRYLKNHEYAQAQQQVLTVHSDDSIDVAIQIPEQIFQAMIGQRSQQNNADWLLSKVNFSAESKQYYAAKVKEVSTVADADTSSFEVTLTLPRPDNANLYPGMAATAILKMDQQTGPTVVTLPQGSVFKHNGEDCVWLIEPSSRTIKATPVVIENKKLISGLQDGDLIVATGVQDLQAGQQVTTWVKERGL